MLKNMLLISTANIAESTAIDLNHGERFGVNDLFVGDYGYIFVPGAVIAAAAGGASVPPELLNIAQYADGQDAGMVYLDCDVKPEPDNGLQVFDW